MRNREPTFLPIEDLKTDSGFNRKIILAAAGVTIAGLVTALILGRIGYDIRRTNMHEARLKGILVQTPTVYQVTEGLKEKAPLAEIVENQEELHEAVDRWGGDQRAEILEKASRWPQLRIFAAGDMMYFIFFDEHDIMRGYVYVTAR